MDHLYIKLKVFDPVAKNKSSDGVPVKLNSKRMKELDKLKGKPIGEELVILHDEHVSGKVYEVNRSLLRLNPNNGRFDSALDRLIGIRRRAGIKNPSKFNMDDDRLPKQGGKGEKYYDPDTKEEPMGGDVEQIRNLIKGVYPKDDAKWKKYQKLLKGMKKYASKKKNNGQKVHGIVLADGTYVNANRRDCVLEDLSRQTKGAAFKKFSKIRVVICDPETWESDVDAMEMHEQESDDFLERFNRIDTAKKIYKYYSRKCQEEGLELIVNGNWQSKIIDLTNSWMEGREIKNTEGSLNLYVFSTKLLKKIARGKIKDKDLWRISTDDDEQKLSCSVSEVLGDGGYADQYYKADTPTKKEKILNFACGLVQNIWFKYQKSDEGKKDLQEMKKYGHREVRWSIMKPVIEDTKNAIGTSGYYKDKDIGSEAFRKAFDDALAKGVGKTSDRAQIDQPMGFLKNIEERVKSLHESLGEDEDKETVKKRANRLLEQEGIDKIDELIVSLDEFKKSIRQKSSPQQKRQPKTTKRGGKRNRINRKQKRVRAGKHSRR